MSNSSPERGQRATAARLKYAKQLAKLPTGRRMGDKTKFAMVPEWVLWDPDVTTLAIKVYAVLHRHADKYDGKAWPSERLIASEVRRGVTQVKAALKVLRLMGALEWVTECTRDGRQNFYVVHETPPDWYPHPTTRAGWDDVDEGGQPENRPTPSSDTYGDSSSDTYAEGGSAGKPADGSAGKPANNDSQWNESQVSASGRRYPSTDNPEDSAADASGREHFQGVDQDRRSTRTDHPAPLGGSGQSLEPGDVGDGWELIDSARVNENQEGGQPVFRPTPSDTEASDIQEALDLLEYFENMETG